MNSHASDQYGTSTVQSNLPGLGSYCPTTLESQSPVFPSQGFGMLVDDLTFGDPPDMDYSMDWTNDFDKSFVSVSSRGRQPLHQATQNEHTLTVKLLLTKGAEVNAQDENGITPLFIAAQKGNADIVSLLLDSEADTSLNTFESCRQPIHQAAQEGHLKVVDLLVSKEADVSAEEKDGATPLWLAAQDGHSSIVSFLLERGAKADTSAKDSGRRPIHQAVQGGHLKVIEMLASKEVSIDEPAYNSVTALWLASQNGYISIVSFLLERGAKVDTSSKDPGRRPIHQAAQGGHLKVIEMLASKEVSIDEPAYNGVTALWLAAQNGHISIVSFLLERGAKVDTSSKDSGRRPIHQAAQGGYLKVIEMLASKEVSIDKPAYNGVTALWLAS